MDFGLLICTLEAEVSKRYHKMHKGLDLFLIHQKHEAKFYHFIRFPRLSVAVLFFFSPYLFLSPLIPGLGLVLFVCR